MTQKSIVEWQAYPNPGWPYMISIPHNPVLGYVVLMISIKKTRRKVSKKNITIGSSISIKGTKKIHTSLWGMNFRCAFDAYETAFSVNVILTFLSYFWEKNM